MVHRPHGNGDDSSALRITYFYDLPVPSPQAAPIQILNTARALAELGVPVAVRLRRIDAPDEERALAPYGIAPHPLLELGTYSAWRMRLGARALRPRADEPAAYAAWDIALSRGESALALLPWLQRRRADPRHRFVYEAHRLCHTRAARPRALGPGRILPAAWAARRTRRAEAAIVAIADGVVCLGDGVRAALEDAFGLPERVLVLPSGTTVPDQAAVPGDSERDVDVVYAGKLEPRKGADVLVEALARLPGRVAWVAGGRREQVAALRRLAEARGVASRVITTGHIAPVRVWELMRRARVGVCPLPPGDEVSERFTSPLKILEMMAWGVPIVATDLPSVRALLEHERTALLVEPGSAEALARGVAALLADRGLAARLASAARAEVVRYSWRERAARLLAFLRSLP